MAQNTMGTGFQPLALARAGYGVMQRWLLPMLALLATLPFFGRDALHVLAWYLCLTAFGWAALPLARALLPRWPGLWLLVARPLGLLLGGLLCWTVVGLGFAPYSPLIAALCFILLAIALRIPQLRRREWIRTGQMSYAGIAAELLFILVFALWAWQRGMQPAIDGLEKFMDLSLLTTMNRGSILPPLDPWLAGARVNYYVFGQFLWTLPMRILGTPPPIAYNLALAGVVAFFVGLAGAVGALLVDLGRGLIAGDAEAPANMRPWHWLGAALAALYSAIAGNGHDFFYGPGMPGRAITRLVGRLGVEVGSLENYAFSDATRFIGYNPETADRTIHEFPWYSFLVADLHAHLINTTVVLLGLILLIQLHRRWQAEGFGSRAGRVLALGYAACCGLSIMANYWDFVIYTGLFGLVWLSHVVRAAQGARREGAAGWRLDLGLLCYSLLLVAAIFFLRLPAHWSLGIYVAAAALSLWLTRLRPHPLVQAAALLPVHFAVAHACAWTFNRHFVPMSDAVRLTTERSPLWQLFVLWGPGLLLALSLLLWLGRGRRGLRGAALQLPLAFIGMAALLIALPELVYVVDIYGGSFKRANTMFKFTYQAHILIGLVCGALLALLLARGWRVLAALRRGRRGISPRRLAALVPALALVALALVPLAYPWTATWRWLPRPDRAAWRGLDGSAWLSEAVERRVELDGRQYSYRLDDDRAIIDWLNREIAGQPVVLEAAGLSYTHFARISTYTGLPTVIGWQTHEWLWRTSRERPNAYAELVLPRQEEVATIYREPHSEAAARSLAHYGVDYIVVGALERIRYPELDEDGLARLGETVLEHGEARLIRVARD